MIKKLDWDSDFFQIKVGEFILNNNKNEIGKIDFDLIYVKSDSEFQLDITGFEKTFTEIKTIFSKSNSFFNQSNQEIKRISDVKYNINELYDLAFESGKYSRFKLDKNLD